MKIKVIYKIYEDNKYIKILWFINEVFIKILNIGNFI